MYAYKFLLKVRRIGLSNLRSYMSLILDTSRYMPTSKVTKKRKFFLCNLRKHLRNNLQTESHNISKNHFVAFVIAEFKSIWAQKRVKELIAKIFLTVDCNANHLLSFHLNNGNTLLVSPLLFGYLRRVPRLIFRCCFKFTSTFAF